ncbi:MAG: acyltransferase [Dehalococcoidia bacterium]|nr:acyltransferase [Dehalococcoidia bacterium]
MVDPVPAMNVPVRPEPSTGPGAAFLPELDVIRGTAIIWVLWLHVYFSESASITHWEQWTMRLSHLFAHGAVPMFLFISGFLVARDHSPGFGVFAGRRARRVLIPGLTWMTLAFAYEAWQRGGIDRALLNAYALFDVSGQFYYLIVLATLTIAIYPFLHASRRTTIALAVAMTLANLAMVGWYEQQEIRGNLAVFAYRNPLVWAGFFTVGLAVARAWPDLRWPRAVTLSAVATMAAAGALYAWMYATAEHTPVSYFGISVFTFSAASMFVWPVLARATLNSPARLAVRPMLWLAPYAFAIYLVHKPYFIGWLSHRLVSDTVLAQDDLALMLGLFLVGGAATVAVVTAAPRLWPWGARVLMGVESTAPRPEHDERAR